MTTAYLLERAWVDGAVHDDVLVEVDDGRFTRVEVGGAGTAPGGGAGHGQGAVTAPGGGAGHGQGAVTGSVPGPGQGGGPTTRSARSSLHGGQSHPRSAPLPVPGAYAGPGAPAGGPAPERVPGLTLPGMANAHSHAFHRALRGRTQRERGSFWTWREQMYAVAGRLDPDSYFALARATYREMVAAGFTAVGEFHYLRHQPGGAAYDDPNAMAHALVAAAGEAGIRIALLDTCYLSSGFGARPVSAQLRFGGPDFDRFRAVSEQLNAERPGVVVGTAIHSVRGVPREHLAATAAMRPGAPLHVHLSEQVAENEQCLAAYGVTPARLLADEGVLGPDTTVVHATHLTDEDVRLLGEARAYACFCPTTERDLGDGIGPSRQLHAAGARLTLGSDSHAVVDPFEEMRAVELDERLATQARGHWSAAELLRAAGATGHASLGFPDAGGIAVGQCADLVTLDVRSPRTAGTGADEGTAVFAATAADVTRVVVDGRVVVREGDREDIGRELDAAIGKVWS